MKYRYQRPLPILHRFVQTVLVMEGSPASGGSDLPLVTSGMHALLCETDPRTKSRLTLFGRPIPDEKWMIAGDTSVIAFFFRPYALNTIFKLSAQELKDKPVNLGCWKAQKAIALGLQLLHAGTTEEKVDVLNHFIAGELQSNLNEAEAIQFATDQLMQNPGTDILARLPNELNLTERTFQRIFKKYVGIPANQYRRLCQFYFSFSQLKGKHFDKLNDIAYDNGYFDQSHFIRSFKEFTDSTPNDYLQFGLNRNNK